MPGHPNHTEPAFRYEAFCRDHPEASPGQALGSVRATVTDEQVEGGDHVMEEFHYYPFGMRMEGGYFRELRHWPAKWNPYQYNGKEFFADIGFDLMPYGARYYDPAVGRFTGVDPIADRFAHLSAYNYASNDPVKNIDLYGLQGVGSNDLVSFMVDWKTNGFVEAVGNYFNFGSLIAGSESDQVKTLSKVHTISAAAKDVNDFVQDAVINGAEAVGASGEIVETTGDIIAVSGTVVTPVAPEVGIPMVEAGTVISGAGVVMQMGEDAAKGDFKGVGKKAIVETFPGVMSKPLRNAVDKIEAKDVSKQMIKQQIGNGELIIEQGIDKKINENN